MVELQDRVLSVPCGLRKAPLDQKVLVGVLAGMAVLVIYRTISYWVTGFYVSDEYGYYYDAIQGTTYATRWFFSWLNIAVFRLFGIDSVDSFAYFLPFYLFFWGFLTVFTFYKTLRILRFSERTVALSLISSLFIVSFTLLSLGFLTESVALALTMVGIYFLIKSAGIDPKRTVSFFLYPAASCLCFVAASYTREPDVAFLLGIIPLVSAVTFMTRERIVLQQRAGPNAMILGPPLVVTAITVFFLEYPQNLLTVQVVALVQGFGMLFAGLCVMSILYLLYKALRMDSASLVFVSVAALAGAVYLFVPYLAGAGRYSPGPTVGGASLDLLRNTLVIFLGGLVLGWGPPMFASAVAGIVVLSSWYLRSKNRTYVLVLALILLALGSYVVVAYIFSPDPNYFSFANYSTMIRFSDTALPACFLAAPFALNYVARSRRVTVIVAVALLAFVLFAVPAYETYATSNLGYVGTNPFNLSYRSPAVQVEDYFLSNPSQSPTSLVGVPYGWYFTPGLERIGPIQLYSTTREHSLSPYLNSSEFSSLKWRTFFIYTSTNVRDGLAQAPYLMQFVEPSGSGSGIIGHANFTIVDREVVISDPSFLLIKIQLSWQ